METDHILFFFANRINRFTITHTVGKKKRLPPILQRLRSYTSPERKSVRSRIPCGSGLLFFRAILQINAVAPAEQSALHHPATSSLLLSR